MPNRWLPFLIIGFLTVVVLIFYAFSIKPIDLTPPESHTNPTAQSQPVVTFINPSKGAQNPRLTIVEFGDFKCDHCASIQTAITMALRAFPNDVRVVWKNLPNPSANPQSIPASVAAHCADRQGKFWEYHDALFARQNFLSDDVYQQIADELTLDTKRFSACLNGQETFPIVEKDMNEGLSLGIVATPTLFIGSQKTVGVVSADELINIIRDELAKN